MFFLFFIVKRTVLCTKHDSHWNEAMLLCIHAGGVPIGSDFTFDGVTFKDNLSFWAADFKQEWKVFNPGRTLNQIIYI